MADLRDLEADRRRLADLDCDLQTVGLSKDWQQEAVDIAIASLDEIERLKRLTVFKNCNGRFYSIFEPTKFYDRDLDAWAAVRKAAQQ